MQRCFLILIIVLLPFISLGQYQSHKFSISELNSLLKKEYADINDFLLVKGWEIDEVESASPHSKGRVTWVLGNNKATGSADRLFSVIWINDQNVAVAYACTHDVANAIKAEIASFKYEKVKTGVNNDRFLYTDYAAQTFVVRVEVGKDQLSTIYLFPKDIYYKTQYDN